MPGDIEVGEYKGLDKGKVLVQVDHITKILVRPEKLQAAGGKEKYVEKYLESLKFSRALSAKY